MSATDETNSDVRGHRRHGSIERYRPGALYDESRENARRAERDLKPLPVEDGHDRSHQRGNNNAGNSFRRGGRRGGGWGRGRGAGGGGHPRNGGPAGDGGEAQLHGAMEALKIGEGDLRHRLNQRSRDPEPPAVGDGEGEARNGGGGGGGGGNRKNHRRIQGRGGGFGTAAGNLPRPKRNTENFNPCHAPCDVRVLVAYPGLSKYNREYTSRDVLMVSDLFCNPDDLTIYNKLLSEIKNCGVEEDILWQSWHGDSHVIADDKKRWKDACPTFHWVVEKIADYFDMDVKATRLNWYRDSSEWKPFHHDAAAVKADKAKTQNFTVAVSFGAEREAAFEHAKTKTTIGMPQPNGTVYTFGRDVNILWRHGIRQVPEDKFSDQGRISIIAWGWNKQTDV